MKHHNRIVSDQSAVTISLDLFEIQPSYNWRFSPTLISDASFCEHLTELLTEFLKLMTRVTFQIQHYGKA